MLLNELFEVRENFLCSMCKLLGKIREFRTVDILQTDASGFSDLVGVWFVGLLEFLVRFFTSEFLPSKCFFA